MDPRENTSPVHSNETTKEIADAKLKALVTQLEREGKTGNDINGVFLLRESSVDGAISLNYVTKWIPPIPARKDIEDNRQRPNTSQFTVVSERIVLTNQHIWKVDNDSRESVRAKFKSGEYIVPTKEYIDTHPGTLGSFNQVLVSLNLDRSHKLLLPSTPKMGNIVYANYGIVNGGVIYANAPLVDNTQQQSPQPQPPTSPRKTGL